MKKTLSKHKSLLKGELASVRQFYAEIAYLKMSIDKAIAELPNLRKQIAHYEKMLPTWQDQLNIDEKSLKLHLRCLQRYKTKCDLAAKIDLLQRKIRCVNQELRRMV